MKIREFKLMTCYNERTKILTYLLYENCGIKPLFVTDCLDEMDDYISDMKLYEQPINNEE